MVGCQNKEAELARIAELEEAIEAKEKALAEQKRQAQEEAKKASLAKEAKRLAEEKAAKEAAEKDARLQELAQVKAREDAANKLRAAQFGLEEARAQGREDVAARGQMAMTEAVSEERKASGGSSYSPVFSPKTDTNRHATLPLAQRLICSSGE